MKDEYTITIDGETADSITKENLKEFILDDLTDTDTREAMLTALQHFMTKEEFKDFCVEMVIGNVNAL